MLVSMMMSSQAMNCVLPVLTQFCDKYPIDIQPPHLRAGKKTLTACQGMSVHKKELQHSSLCGAPGEPIMRQMRSPLLYLYVAWDKSFAVWGLFSYRQRGLPSSRLVSR